MTAVLKIKMTRRLSLRNSACRCVDKIFLKKDLRMSAPPKAVAREGRIYLVLIGRTAADFPTFYEGRSTPLRPMPSRAPNLQERRLANAFQDKHG